MTKKLTVSVILLSFLVLLISCQDEKKSTDSLKVKDYGITNQKVLADIKEGIHQPTGLIAGNGITEVLVKCLSCHSSKLITQNRATADGWKSMIEWMYETQNLPNLGESEPIIIAYLAEHYAPTTSGRRKALTDIDWYELSD